jgi:DnaK suppressor protein
MSSDFLSACETQLLQMKRDLLAQIERQRGEAHSRAEATAQARDLLQEDERIAAVEMELNMALGDREIVELNEIEAAINRLTQGRYGECTDCGVGVGEARLRAFPAAARCVSCQTKRENAHGRPHFATL